MMSTADSFPAGMLAGVSIAAGYFPVALAFGLSAYNTGLSLFEGTTMSLAVFAGAAQFLTLGMLSAGAAPLQILLAGVLLNLRHLLFSAAIADRTPNWLRRSHALAAFGLTDEVFAAASIRQRLTPGYLIGMELTAYSSWVAGSAVGFAAGELLPHGISLALGTALYGLFAALLAIHLRSSWRTLIPAGLAAATHILLGHSGLDSGWAFTAAILAGSLGGALLPAAPGDRELQETADAIR